MTVFEKESDEFDKNFQAIQETYYDNLYKNLIDSVSPKDVFDCLYATSILDGSAKPFPENVYIIYKNKSETIHYSSLCKSEYWDKAGLQLKLYEDIIDHRHIAVVCNKN